MTTERTKVDRNDLRKNGSGYFDPTAYEACTRVLAEECVVVADNEIERFNKLLRVIFSICELAGFKVEGRIVLKDLKTGKVWR